MKTSEVIIAKRVITPSEAKKLLETTANNRRIHDRWVNFYYHQMMSNQWIQTGDTIKLSPTGKLLDGQHRLSALVKGGKAVEMFIAENVDEKAFAVLDTGKTRSGGDILSIKGMKNSSKLASAVRYILLFKSSYYSNDYGAGKKANATNQKILEFVEANESIHEIVTHVNLVQKKFAFIPASSLIMLYWILSRKNQTRCDIFFEKYATGIDLSENSPIRLLRERLLRNSVNKTKLINRDKVALFIMAWNAFILGKRTQQLTLAKNYKFPKPA